MVAILKRIWPYLVAVAVVLAALYGAYRHGVATTTDRYELKLAEQAKANADALASAHFKARVQEMAAAVQLADIDAKHQQELKDAQTRTERTIAELRAGNIRLRDELASAECALAGVSDIATGTGQRDAACTGGLRPEHAEFLIRFADRADEVTMQLQAAQDVIRADRIVCGLSSEE